MTSSLELRLASGNAFSGSDFVFGAPGGYAEELTRTLQRAGFAAEVPLSHGAGGEQTVEILVTLLKASGGIEALAKVVATFLARHEKKRVVLSDGTSMDGYSASEVAKILGALHQPSQQSIPPTTSRGAE